MARPISDEELQLKKRARRRLVGAIVLVSIVAVVLPMALDSEPRPNNQSVDIQIPAPDSGELKPAPAAPRSSATETTAARVPESSDPVSTSAVPAPSVSSEISGASTKPSPSGSPPAGSVSDSSDATTAEVKPGSVAREGSQSAVGKERGRAGLKDATVPGGGGYVIQVAALADSARVRQLQKQIAGVGMKTYTETVPTKTGEVTRVRAGPYPTREAAEKARTQLKKAGLDGKVVPN